MLIKTSHGGIKAVEFACQLSSTTTTALCSALSAGVVSRFSSGGWFDQEATTDEEVTGMWLWGSCHWWWESSINGLRYSSRCISSELPFDLMEEWPFPNNAWGSWLCGYMPNATSSRKIYPHIFVYASHRFLWIFWREIYSHSSSSFLAHIRVQLCSGYLNSCNLFWLWSDSMPIILLLLVSLPP